MDLNNLVSCIDTIKYTNKEEAKLIFEAAVKDIKIKYGSFDSIAKPTPETLKLYQGIAQRLKSIETMLYPVSKEFSKWLWNVTYGE